MWRVLLVVALVSCGKSKQEKEREQACRDERDSAARYMQIAIDSFDRIPAAREPRKPRPPRPPDKNLDTAFMETALDDEGALVDRGTAIAKADADARKKMSDAAQDTLKRAKAEFEKTEGDPVSAAKSAQTVFAQLDQISAESVKQYAALIKDIGALRDRIAAKPLDQIKDQNTRDLLTSVRDDLGLEASALDIASKPVDVFGVQKVSLQQVITACSR